MIWWDFCAIIQHLKCVINFRRTSYKLITVTRYFMMHKNQPIAFNSIKIKIFLAFTCLNGTNVFTSLLDIFYMDFIWFSLVWEDANTNDTWTKSLSIAIKLHCLKRVNHFNYILQNYQMKSVVRRILMVNSICELKTSKPIWEHH